MIKGNVMDTFTVAFDNGEEFALMAYSATNARLMACELCPGSTVLSVRKLDEWQEND